MLQLLAVFVLRRREGGKWGSGEGRGGTGTLHHACHMIRAKQKPINQLKSIQRMKATHSDFIPYATAT